MRDTRDPSNTPESRPAFRASRLRRGLVQAVLLACAAGALPALSGCAGQGAKAEAEMLPNESVVRVPVQVALENGGQARGELVVTVFTPQGEGRHPLMVISHARPATPPAAPAGPRALCDGGPLFHRRWLRRGRAGAAGLWRHWRPRSGKQRPLRRPAFHAHVQPCRERDRAGDRGDGAAAGRGSGQRGGAGPVGGRRLDRGAGGGQAAGVRAAINFAGGSGGDPVKSPGKPCGPERLQETYAGYAATTRMPMLWIYTENDLYWGPEWPQRWAEAYNAAGGHAQFERLGPDGDNGHSLFTHAPEKWKPLVRDFLRAQGYAMPEPGAASGQARRP
ncbi:hypothetical protein WJ970_19455 [Achromobacter xylosoxidans]